MRCIHVVRPSRLGFAAHLSMETFARVANHDSLCCIDGGAIRCGGSG
jgi:hypothetical protein